MNKVGIQLSLITILITIFAFFSYWSLNTSKHLTFSDSAKIAQSARFLITQNKRNITHRFFNSSAINKFSTETSWPAKSAPLVPSILSLVFRFLPAHDTTIAFVGGVTLVLAALLVALITFRLYSFSAALAATVFFVFNPHFLEYAVNFAPEILFILEVLLFAWFFIKTNKQKYWTIPIVVLMFFTRPQVIVVAAAALLIIITRSFLKYNWNNRLKLILTFILLSAIIFKLLPLALSISFSPARYTGAINYSPQVSSGIYLRQGVSASEISLADLLSKTAYNIYNFATDLSRLLPTPFWLLLILGLWIHPKSSKHKTFTYFTLLSVALAIFAASISLPNARYIHPFIPLVIISSTIALIEIINRFRLSSTKLPLVIISLFLILPSLGNIFVDYRFRSQSLNLSKPPAYRVISSIMAQHIPQEKLIITNLDAWASWYEKLTTMWFPLNPDQLITKPGQKNNVDYIVITNYNEHDADFALNDWKEVVYNPTHIKNEFLQNNYRLLDSFIISADQVYENQEYKGTILVKK